jgi:hypothetical protein
LIRLAKQQEKLGMQQVRLQTLSILLASLAPAPADERQRRKRGN